MLVEVVAVQRHQHHQLRRREEVGAQQQAFALVRAVARARCGDQALHLGRDRVVEVQRRLVEIHQVHVHAFLIVRATSVPHSSSASQTLHCPSSGSPCRRRVASSTSMRSIRQAIALPTGSGIRWWSRLMPSALAAPSSWRSTTRPGMPTTVRCAGTSFTTTELAPTRTWSPSAIGPSTLAPAPITTWFPKVGWRLPLFQLVPPSVTP